MDNLNEDMAGRSVAYRAAQDRDQTSTIAEDAKFTGWLFLLGAGGVVAVVALLWWLL